MLKRLKVIKYIYIYIYERSKKNCTRKKEEKELCLISIRRRSNSLWNYTNQCPSNPARVKKSWESTSTLNFSVTLVNHSILTMCTQTHLAISGLPSLPLKLFNSLPKKKKLKWMCWRPLVGSRNHTQYPKTWCSFPS